jgi:hypothetical protein
VTCRIKEMSWVRRGGVWLMSAGVRGNVWVMQKSGLHTSIMRLRDRVARCLTCECITSAFEAQQPFIIETSSDTPRLVGSMTERVFESDACFPQHNRSRRRCSLGTDCFIYRARRSERQNRDTTGRFCRCRVRFLYRQTVFDAQRNSPKQDLARYSACSD